LEFRTEKAGKGHEKKRTVGRGSLSLQVPVKKRGKRTREKISWARRSKRKSRGSKSTSWRRKEGIKMRQICRLKGGGTEVSNQRRNRESRKMKNNLKS